MYEMKFISHALHHLVCTCIKFSLSPMHCIIEIHRQMAWDDGVVPSVIVLSSYCHCILAQLDLALWYENKSYFIKFWLLLVLNLLPSHENPLPFPFSIPELPGKSLILCKILDLYFLVSLSCLCAPDFNQISEIHFCCD